MGCDALSLVRSDVSEEHIAYTIRVGTFSELGTTLAVTRFVQEPHGVTSRKTALVAAVKISSLTNFLQEPHDVVISQKAAFFIYEFHVFPLFSSLIVLKSKLSRS
jgi:hypothetical protein